MSLTTPPNPPTLIAPDAPFLVTAIWYVTDAGSSPPSERGRPGDYHPQFDQLHIAAAEYLGAWPHEYAIGAQLARPLGEVERSELPIALALRARVDPLNGRSYWAFEYLGGAEFFAVDQLAPPIPVVEPTPMSPAQLSASADAMLRDSLGLGPDDPLPVPAGPLPPSEQPEEPYRFDPHPHMDLTKAEPPPDFHGEEPASAPPGPPPAPDATTSPVPQLPPPAPPGPGVSPDAEPFCH